MDLSDPNLGVRYSIDGGRSWLEDGNVDFDNGQANVSLPSSGTSLIFHSDATVKVNDPDDPSVTDGTWLWVRPSARYVGDDKDVTAQGGQGRPGQFHGRGLGLADRSSAPTSQCGSTTRLRWP